MFYLLDTDHMTFLERGGSEGEAIYKRLRSLPPDDYGTTIINFEEQVRGRLAQTASARTSEKRLVAYERLQECRRIYNGYAVVDFSPKAEAFYNLLLSKKVNIGTQDLKIASIVLANEATLLTRNTRDFGKVPGLVIEDWTTE